MEAWILDKNERTIGMVEAYESFIWTERFQTCGDFEIVLPIEYVTPELLTVENRIARQGSKAQMIIEQVKIETDVSGGTKAKITGRSLESILERRVLAASNSIHGNLQNGVKAMLSANVIAPDSSPRAIPSFVFETCSEANVVNLRGDVEYTLGENLLDVMLDICQGYDIGYRILPNGSGGFTFALYGGTERTYDQTKVPFVIFSPEFDNITSSNYYEDKTTEKTACFVVGAEHTTGKQVETQSTIWVGSGSGLSRRELFVDGSSVDTPEYEDEVNFDSDTKWSEVGAALLDDLERLQKRNAAKKAEYEASLRGVGNTELTKATATQMFDGEIDGTRQFVYEKDFFVGDIVQVENEYGIVSRARVSELVYSHDANGEALYPTFTIAQ